MYLANFKDDEKNKWFLGNCSKGGVFIDECLVYDFKTEKYFMVEKYNNDIGKSGMFFCTCYCSIS